MSRRFSKVVVANLEESVIAALAKLAPDVSWPIAGKVVASRDLQAQLRNHVDTKKATDDARARLSQLVDLYQSQHAVLTPVLAGIRSHAAALYGELTPEFASFGFKPRKVPQRTVASKAEAADKLRATRTARHTMGKRQRSAIHGTVPPQPPSNGPVVAAPAASVQSGANGTPTTRTTNGTSH